MSKQILSPMMGNMWKILVKEGDSFAVGDTVAILESMKMEIPIEAEEDGVVEKMLVSEEDVIDEEEPILNYV